MNTRLLRRIQKAIKDEPKSLDMDLFYRDASGIATDCGDSLPLDNPYIVTTCDTPGCIAGHAVSLTKTPVFPGESIEGKAAEVLGLDAHQQCILFYTFDWPYKFEQRYNEAKTERGRASATVARIEHFIQTKGVE